MAARLTWCSAPGVAQLVSIEFFCVASTNYGIYNSPACIVLDAPAKLSKILIGMNKELGEIPVTVKLRTGVKEGRNTAHKLMPRLAAETGIGAVTVGRINVARGWTLIWTMNNSAPRPDSSTAVHQIG